MGELLESIKTYLGEDYDQRDDGKILIFLEEAVEEVCNRRYPFGFNDQEKERAIEKYKSVIRKAAIYMYDRQGIEGEVSHSESGTSVTYESAGIPPSFFASVTPMCKLM